MSVHQSLRVRRSLTALQAEYESGNKKPLEDLMRAWRGIKALPPEDPSSFFVIGGYHGEPFRGAGWGNNTYWGGYCNHGNVLFPTWHRAYLLRLEDALRSIPGCEDVALPFWDETSEDSRKNGIPWALTVERFQLDGEWIDNPIRSFAFPRNIVDQSGDTPNYAKPKGYQTVRYPLSGLVGTPADRAATEKHNAQFPDYQQNVAILDKNIVNWLNEEITVDGKTVSKPSIYDQYRACLDAPNYTVFSNTTSVQEWNANLESGKSPVIPLESPHNHIHLAVGGFDYPNVSDASPIEGANGDMGENNTAALDPIFYFHHCFVDYVFWQWQVKNGHTERLEVIPEYPGTNSVDSQGPTPGTPPNSWLTLDSPLDPFKKQEHGRTRAYTSNDMVNIEAQLGYTYGPGSLSDVRGPAVKPVPEGASKKVVRVSGINRAPIRGSFLVSVFANVGGKKVLVGTEAVLSRWNVKYCANCQTHLEVKAFVPLHRLSESDADAASFDVELHTRDGVITGTQAPPGASEAIRTVIQSGKKPFRIEVR